MHVTLNNYKTKHKTSNFLTVFWAHTYEIWNKCSTRATKMDKQIPTLLAILKKIQIVIVLLSLSIDWEQINTEFIKKLFYWVFLVKINNKNTFINTDIPKGKF